MSTHATSFFATWARECAESDGHSDAQSFIVSSLTAVEVNGSPTFAPIIGGFFNPGIGVAIDTGGRGGSRCSQVSGGNVQGFIGYVFNNGGGTVFAVWCVAGETTWTIDGVAVDNGGTPCIRTNDRYPPSGPELVWDGAAALIINAAGWRVEGRAVVAYPAAHPYRGRSQFIDFSEQPPDTDLQTIQAVSRIRAILGAPTASYNVGAPNGPDRILRNCNYAGIDPAGVLWLRPEDLGNQANQIPNDVVQNTADHFRYFPNAFFRRTSYVDGLQSANVDPLAIDAAPVDQRQPFTLRTVQFQPETSMWLLVIDGQDHLVRIDHPAGSDLRRPDEIWNAVWVPLLSSASGPPSSATSDSPYVYDIFGTLGDQVGLFDRLQYVQYARMLGIAENNGGFQVQDVPQNFPIIP